VTLLEMIRGDGLAEKTNWYEREDGSYVGVGR
jgi:hypothetical protein